MKNTASYLPLSHRSKIVFEKLKKVCWSIIRAVIIIGLCFEILYPFIIKILQSFMTTTDLLDPTVKIFPREFSFDNIIKTFTDINYIQSFFNTFILSFTLSVIQLLVCTTIGYGFARFKFKLNGFFFTMLIITLVIPIQLYNTSAFIYFKNLNTIGSLAPFYILAITGLGMKNGLFVFLMRQFFRGLPKELEDAAYIDGCGIFYTYVKIILPNARNMLVTVFILSFAWQWTDYFYSTLFMINEKFQTLPLAILNNIKEIETGGNRLGPIMFAIEQNIACIMAILPILILYAIFQNKLISGIENSGLTGE